MKQQPELIPQAETSFAKSILEAFTSRIYSLFLVLCVIVIMSLCVIVVGFFDILSAVFIGKSKGSKILLKALMKSKNDKKAERGNLKFI